MKPQLQTGNPGVILHCCTAVAHCCGAGGAPVTCAIRRNLKNGFMKKFKRPWVYL